MLGIRVIVALFTLHICSVLVTSVGIMEARTVVASGVDPSSSYQDLSTLFSKAGEIQKIVRVLDSDLKPTERLYVVYTSADSVVPATSQLSTDTLQVQKLGADKSEFKALVMEEEVKGLDFMQQWQNFSPLQQQQMIQKMQSLSLVKQEPTEASPPLHVSTSPQETGATSGDAHHTSHHPPGASPRTPGSAFFSDNVVIQQKLPHIPPFSGTEKDCSFGRWRFEVECVNAEAKYTDSTKREAVRKSLKSPAADVLPLLGLNPSVQQILNKLESIHGIVLSGQALMEKFYKEEQGQRSCAKWSTQLEDWIYQALCKKALPAESVPATLKHRFWSGLSNTDIKNALRFRHETLTYEELVTEARAVEQEVKPKEKSTSHQATSSESTMMELLMKKIDGMTTGLRNLNNEVQMLKNQGSHSKSPSSSHGSAPSAAAPSGSRGPVRCTKCNLEGHYHYACRQGKEVECFRCGGREHVANGCRNKKKKKDLQ